MNQGSSAYGTISYNSLSAFEANNPIKRVSRATIRSTVCARRSSLVIFRTSSSGGRTFTLNLGLRYSFFSIFHEVQGRGNPFDFATCGPQGYCGVGASFGPPNYADFDPRVSFAWAPAKFGGKTVIRAGFGIYHEDGQLDDQNIPDKNEVLSYALTSKNCPGLSYPLDLDSQRQSGLLERHAVAERGTAEPQRLVCDPVGSFG